MPYSSSCCTHKSLFSCLKSEDFKSNNVYIPFLFPIFILALRDVILSLSFPPSQILSALIDLVFLPSFSYLQGQPLHQRRGQPLSPFGWNPIPSMASCFHLQSLLQPHTPALKQASFNPATISTSQYIFLTFHHPS